MQTEEVRRAKSRDYMRKRREDPEFKAKERDNMRKKRGETPHLAREYDLRVRYGLTLEQYNNMVEAQGGRCAICGTEEPGAGRNHLFIDHCHETGVIRGLLCHHCNVGLGRFKNVSILQAAINYLGRSQ